MDTMTVHGLSMMEHAKNVSVSKVSAERLVVVVGRIARQKTVARLV